MSSLYPSRLQIAAAAAVILVAGAIAGGLTYRQAARHAAGDVMHDAALAAAAFDSADITHVAREGDAASTTAYSTVKRRLQKIAAAWPNVRYVYIFRAQSPDRIIFLADSKGDNSPDSVKPGDPYEAATSSPTIRELLRSGGPAFEGTLRDASGSSVTAYATIGEGAPHAASTAPIEALGLEVDASGWTRNVWLAAIRGASYLWILFGLPLFVFVTSRQQGEQREAIRNLSEAVEQSPSAITILDLGQRIEYANRGVCQQIGYARRELIGRHLRDFIAGPASNAIVGDLVSTIRMGRNWEGEWLNQRKDGTAYPVHGVVTPVKHRDGTVACFVAMFDDVTETKRKEAELRDARDLAQAGDRAKGQFLATMSHEVRTPLNGIVGFTSLLLETPLSAEQREFVQTIRASGEALIQLTGDILDYARIESGKLKLDAIPSDPRECVEEALDMHATKAAGKNIELLHRADDDVPSAVLVDSGRLRQVLVNLIGNAVKFTDRGEVEARVRVVEITPAARTADQASASATPEMCVLEFTIRDTGIGISPEQQSRLFKPFSQGDESSTRRYGGAGLGLAICKNLVQLMGGTIALESSAGQGTTITFTIRAPVTARQPPVRNLDKLRVGLAMRSGPLRRELVNLLRSWNAEIREVNEPAELAGADWETALVEVAEATATDWVSRTEPMRGLPPEKTLALVPISLTSDLRSALRTHFRLLVNRPIHQGPLFAILSGTRPSAHAPAVAATQFGFRVLVVEDNEVNQRLLLRVLSTLGCTAHVVANGVLAIAELTEHAGDYDVVLLDLHMPEMDGLQALERIRRGDAGPRARTCWIIALTADVRPEQRIKGFDTGLNDFLTKPLRVTELETALRRFRDDRKSRAS